LSDSDDLKTAMACVAFCREIGNSAPLRSFVKREFMPGNLKGPELENFIQDAATSYWHVTCTAKSSRERRALDNLPDLGVERFGVRSCFEHPGHRCYLMDLIRSSRYSVLVPPKHITGTPIDRRCQFVSKQYVNLARLPASSDASFGYRSPRGRSLRTKPPDKFQS
jgi:hypothetical protein